MSCLVGRIFRGRAYCCGGAGASGGLAYKPPQVVMQKGVFQCRGLVGLKKSPTSHLVGFITGAHRK